MTTIPYITVQLVHIQGPLKGEILEVADSEIRIGRHPDCQVRFPKDDVTLSRIHARIVREGNRFKLVDESTNGTYVNGLRVPEAYLKDGDVIMFAEGGPKVSFLTQTASAPPAKPVASQPQAAGTPPPSPPEPRRPTAPAAAAHTPPSTRPAAQTAPHGPAEPVKVSFAIQYGPALKSFNTLPIVLGKGAGCDFVINHPAVSDRHAQIFFTHNQYWIKDLTGAQTILLDGQPIPTQSALVPDMQLALTGRGPRFRFLGGGRLAEIEDPLPEQPAVAQPVPDAPQKAEKSDGLSKKAGSLFKKFFT
jgi:pSer/pThr/pTyr-binding forkhead associated (FHA) protein